MPDIKKITRELEKLTCPDHGEHPAVSVEKGQVLTSSCCDKLSDLVHERMQDIFFNDAIDKTLGGNEII